MNNSSHRYLFLGLILGSVLIYSIQVFAVDDVVDELSVSKVVVDPVVKDVRSPEYKKRIFDLSKSRDENLRLDVSQYTDIEVAQNNTDRIVQQLQRIEAVLIRIEQNEN